jgi:hypothetical protein
LWYKAVKSAAGEGEVYGAFSFHGRTAVKNRARPVLGTDRLVEMRAVQPITMNPK